MLQGAGGVVLAPPPAAEDAPGRSRPAPGRV